MVVMNDPDMHFYGKPLLSAGNWPAGCRGERDPAKRRHR